jgi:hypothetical protein
MGTRQATDFQIGGVMELHRGFVAYPSNPPQIGETIENAVRELRERGAGRELKSWRQLDTCGHFIADQLLGQIEESSVVIADISKLNFNVIYEVGFAIGRGKPVALIRNSALNVEDINLTEFGIFDTLGYENYTNASELIRFLFTHADIAPIDFPVSRNSRAPVYVVEPKYKTDFINRIVSRLHKARLTYRSFDPNEQPRMSAFEAIENVAQSYGIVTPLLAPQVQDARVHNLRAAFVAGLADGMGRVRLIVQEGDAPVPIDFRDFAKSCYKPERTDEVLADFAAEVVEQFQAAAPSAPKPPENFLQTVSLGSSSAENEIADLVGYYLEIDSYQKAARGEVRLVVGRKGAGKTAIFFRVQDRMNRNRKNVVVDLKPEGYQLRKLRDAVLRLLGEGTKEHTLMAFWEYLLLLEIVSKILELDKERYLRDQDLFPLYQQLNEKFLSDESMSRGDFSDRMNTLIQHIGDQYARSYGKREGEVLDLAEQEVTQLVYKHNVGELRTIVGQYLRFKDELWILFDNLDKGWPTKGLEPEDVLMIRILLEATRKIEQDLRRREIVAHTIVFLRNDIYDLLIADTPDRGKEVRATVDWLDPDLLREVIRLRLIKNGMLPQTEFQRAWAQIAAGLVDGEESSQYLIERCLMRPRALIDLINHCRSSAVNLRHSRIEEDDFKKGLHNFSNDLVSEINLEIRDVVPEAEDVLYHFIGSGKIFTGVALEEMLIREGRTAAQIPQILDVLLWHGVLGVVLMDGKVQYIYDANYNMKILKAQISKLESQNVRSTFQINPAFWSALGVH